MDFLSKIIKLFFGSKADKDRKEIEPYVQKVLDIYPSIKALSNDELRGRSAALMQKIADFIAQDEAHIVEQKAKLELAGTTLAEKEKIGCQQLLAGVVMHMLGHILYKLFYFLHTLIPLHQSHKPPKRKLPFFIGFLPCV